MSSDSHTSSTSLPGADRLAKLFEVAGQVTQALAVLPDSDKTEVLHMILRQLGSSVVTEGAPMSIESREHLHDTFHQLLESSAVESYTDTMLIAGYWLENHEGLDGFTAAAIGKFLKQEGKPASNLSRDLTRLVDRNLLLAEKHGNTAQAKKTYSLTGAGSARVKKLAL